METRDKGSKSNKQLDDIIDYKAEYVRDDHSQDRVLLVLAMKHYFNALKRMLFKNNIPQKDEGNIFKTSEQKAAIEEVKDINNETNQEYIQEIQDYKDKKAKIRNYAITATILGILLLRLILVDLLKIY